MSPTRFLHEGKRLQGALILAFVLLAAGLGFYVLDSRRIAAKNTTALLALCALRHDKRHELKASETFLRVHPHGIPGIPASLIREGIRNSKHTLRALRILSCGKDD